MRRRREEAEKGEKEERRRKQGKKGARRARPSIIHPTSRSPAPGGNYVIWDQSLINQPELFFTDYINNNIISTTTWGVNPPIN